EIDGYEELFGSQDYCDCEACKSIFSPAAYFTDLMYFVDKYVSKKLFVPSLTNHPLYLKRRRPDLWTLKLSCQNTNTEIPYLQVVNEVLEKYLVQEIPTVDVYETLRTADLSCRQPFNLALEETRLYLAHFGLNLADIYQTLKQPKEEQYREQLLLSDEELQIISTPNPVGAQKRFGNTNLANFDVQEFIRFAGISRPQLDDLLATKFAPSIALVKVNKVKLGTDIQQYTEQLTGLDSSKLDVIHRYLRLWKKTNWSLPEFDLILCSMQAKGILATLEELDGDGHPKILQLALVKFIQNKLGYSPEEMAAIVYRLPLTAIVDNQKPLYFRIFDLEKIFGVNVSTIDQNTNTTLPADNANDKISPLILAGLGITESELEILFQLLGINTSIDQTIDFNLLSALYRHAAIARGLKLGIEDFVHLLGLILGGGAITQLTQIETLIDAATRCKTLPFSISELLLIIKGEESSTLQFANNIHVVSATIIGIQASADKDKKDKKDLLKAYLQSSFNLTTDQLDKEFFTQLLTLNLNSPAIITALNATFADGKPDNAADIDGLLTLMHEFEHLKLLFEKAQFDAGMISFMVNNKEIFGIADLKNLNFNNLLNMVRYHALLNQKDKQRDALNLALQNIQSGGTFSNTENTTFANAWMQPERLIASLTNALSFTLPALDALDYLQNCLSLCITLGLQGDALVKLKHSDHPGLLAARNIVVGAFSSKYPDEKTRNDKLEPYDDKLNTLKRDALCDYIISRSDFFKFKDLNDLYSFFLLDVEMSGCFRTSYLVAAITSVQLYIHRCMTNLEQSDQDLNPGIVDVKVLPNWIPADEWAWRKNYRVWEANRKVFLYPENYIDPTLRDNKTEIFKELEDDLLQQKITQDSAEAAYKKYLSRFSELTRLRYAGGYYHH
ncbi:MAG: neuraminidase-like domain-containing protein, partial [Bdellovibrionales bacterium]